MAMTLTSKQRAYLRSLAHNEKAVFQVGKEGVTPELVAAVTEAFQTRELIKISVLKSVEEPVPSVGETLAGRTRATLVETIGRKVVLYKQDPDEPKIVLPRARERSDADTRA